METDKKYSVDFWYGVTDRAATHRSFEIRLQKAEEIGNVSLDDDTCDAIVSAVNLALALTADGRPLAEPECKQLQESYTRIADSLDIASRAMADVSTILAEVPPEVLDEIECSREYFKVPPFGQHSEDLKALSARLREMVKREDARKHPRGRRRLDARDTLINTLYDIYLSAGGKGKFTRKKEEYREVGTPQYAGKPLAFIAEILDQVWDVLPRRDFPKNYHLVDDIAGVLRKRE
jgi:hypothetical protein